MRQDRRFAVTLVFALCLFLAACISPNRAPIASFTRSPSSGDAPLAVFFDADASIDPDGTIVSYAWAFGDGTEGEGETTTHIYTTEGTFEVTLTVLDDLGSEGTITRAVSVSNPAAPPTTGVDVGQLAPTFTLKALDGPEVSLEDYRGHLVLLDFWRSTCAPCRMTMPHLESLRAEFADDGLVVVTVNLDISEAEARAFLTENGFEAFIVLRGTLSDAQAVRALYEVETIPETFLIDRQGIVRHAGHPILFRSWHIEPWI